MAGTRLQCCLPATSRISGGQRIIVPITVELIHIGAGGWEGRARRGPGPFPLWWGIREISSHNEWDAKPAAAEDDASTLYPPRAAVLRGFPALAWRAPLPPPHSPPSHSRLTFPFSEHFRRVGRAAACGRERRRACGLHYGAEFSERAGATAGCHLVSVPPPRAFHRIKRQSGE